MWKDEIKDTNLLLFGVWMFEEEQGVIPEDNVYLHKLDFDIGYLNSYKVLQATGGLFSPSLTSLRLLTFENVK